VPLERQDRSAAPDRAEIAIGHDILALISSAMYTEPLTVYRELCQNAADAIDEAVAAGTLDADEGRIDIRIDPLHRSIVVRDNGAGVPNDEFAHRMCSIGASRKRGTNARGYRGIGRLVGLGYGQELVFRSRADVGERVQEAVWDCRLLREALRSPAYASLVDVVADVVRISSRRATTDDAEHFFEVELRKVVRLAYDGLLNAALVQGYLSEVAPVPFDRSFSHGNEIATRLQSAGAYSAMAIHLNGDTKPVTRPYRDVLGITANKSCVLDSPTFFEVPGYDGAAGAIGWISHHAYLGAFPRELRVRGLRARIGNLQIGDEACFDPVFPEERFNQWTTGEVHVLDRAIVANGRRDYFEPSLAFEHLCNHLAIQAREVARRCRSSSGERRKQRGIEELDAALATYGKVLKRSRVARILRDELLDDVREQIERTRKKLSASEQGDGGPLSRIEHRIESLTKVGKGEDARATQRQMGQADVLRLLREQVPGGAATSMQLLKILEEQSRD
jgi:hypothetical protein